MMATARQKAASRANLVKARAARKRAAGVSNLRSQVGKGTPIKYRGPYAMSFPIGSKPKSAMHAPITGRYAGFRDIIGKPIKGGLGLGPIRPKKKRG